MGWSCTADVAKTAEKISDFCIKSTGSQNVWKYKGRYFFWETGLREYDDGRISGMVYELLNYDPQSSYEEQKRTTCKKSGSISINPDGSFRRGAHGINEKSIKEVNLND